MGIVFIQHVDNPGCDLIASLAIGAQHITLATDTVAGLQMVTILQSRLGALAHHRVRNGEAHAVLLGQDSMACALTPLDGWNVVDGPDEHADLLAVDNRRSPPHLSCGASASLYTSFLLRRPECWSVDPTTREDPHVR